MAINKVEFGGDTLIDLTGDTVTAGSLLRGVSAHSASGEQIVGEVEVPSKTSDLENDSMFGASWTGTQAEWDALDKSQFPSNTDITIKITDDGEPSPTPTPTPSASGYTIDGLSFSGCSCRSGGYCKVGNIVIVNIELYAMSTTDMIVSGLPSFQNISRARDVRCTIYNESVDEFDETNRAIITNDGMLTVVAYESMYGKYRSIQGMYLCG